MRSKYEILAEKELKSEGWVVDYISRPRMVPRGYHVDYFNLFDLLCWMEKKPLRFISIKGKGGISSLHREEIKAFWVPDGIQKEIWKYDRDPKDKRKIRVKKEIIKESKTLG